MNLNWRHGEMLKSLRAADLGYKWPEWLPDGATWTRDEDGRVEVWLAIPQPSWRYWCPSRCETVPQSVIGQLGLAPPDFGDRHWEQCILIKGHEPELPPCPPGNGWIEWSGGPCPVDGLVDIQLDNGETESGPADSFEWDYLVDHGRGCNIIRYRVHQPRYRPYNDDEMKQLVRVGEYLERKDGTAGSRAWDWQCWDGGILVRVGLGVFKAAELLEHWRHADGRPCGVEVSE